MTDRDPNAPEIERLLSRQQPPVPDDGLRRQILAAAEAVMPTAGPPTLSERIWLSRSWRLGWAAALALLLLGQFLIVRSTERSARRFLGAAATATRPADDAAASMAELMARELRLEIGGSIALASSLPRPRPKPQSPLTELPPEE